MHFIYIYIYKHTIVIKTGEYSFIKDILKKNIVYL